MPATAMFSKFKASSNSTAQHSPLDTNPIVQFFDVGKQTASAGPGLIWRIFDAKRKSDGRVSKNPQKYWKKIIIYLKRFYIFFCLEGHIYFSSGDFYGGHSIAPKTTSANAASASP